MAGQTQSEIRALLAAGGLAPRHQYGQNFLIDLNLMRKLVAAAELRAGDLVLEVGCGTGSLTEMLLEAGVRVVGVEIDRGLQTILRERLGRHPRFTLIQGDALAGKHAVNPLVLQVLAEQAETDRRSVPQKELQAAGETDRRSVPQEEPQAVGETDRRSVPQAWIKLVANLPYQIATPLIMELLCAQPRFERLTCTIQKEVGERLAAEPGSEAYGPASVSMQALAEMNLLAILRPSAFWPRPEIESVMLTICPRAAEQVEVEDVPAFMRFVQRAFVHRRKTLRKASEGWGLPDPSLAFARAGLSEAARPDALSPADWRALYQAVRVLARS